MLQITFTTEERKELHNLRFKHPHPHVQKKMEVLYLKSLDRKLSHELITECNDKYINAQSVCNLLSKIALQHIDIPITVIMDNAKYQHCELVRNFAKKLNIELLFLPSYSPNLNIIERLWKWVKKDCLYCKYYEKFGAFKNAIDLSLSKVGKPEYKEMFDSPYLVGIVF